MKLMLTNSQITIILSVKVFRVKLIMYSRNTNFKFETCSSFCIAFSFKETFLFVFSIYYTLLILLNMSDDKREIN